MQLPSASASVSLHVRRWRRQPTEVGRGKNFTIVTSLIDTNVLVYRYDRRDSRKQRVAEELLRAGVEQGTLRLPHQAIVEFVAACTRSLPGGALLTPSEARREAEEFLMIFDVLYPNTDLVRTALRGAAAYQLSWFDAQMWAYAEHYGVEQLYSEDFQHDRLYGTVRVVNPFL